MKQTRGRQNAHGGTQEMKSRQENRYENDADKKQKITDKKKAI